MTQFRELEIGDTFYFIDPDSRTVSFYDRCKKISERQYYSLSSGFKMSVGTIDCKVFNVTKRGEDETAGATAPSSRKAAAKKMLTPSVMKSRADKYVTKDGDKPAKPVPPSADDLRKVIEKSIHRLTEAKAEFAGTADDAREVWLRRMAKLLEPWFKRAGYDVPAYRVSVGWTSKGVRTKRIGECWDAKVSADGSYQIFISPTQVDSEMVAGILAHELIHAVVGIKAGHGAKFKRCGITALGFEGNASTMCTGKAFKENIQPLLAELGPFPHAKLKPGISSTGRKQPTRMIKCTCPKCGYVARTTEKWLQFGAPVCPTHLKEMTVKL